QGGILVILKDPAVELVGAAFGYSRHIANASEFGGVVDFTHTDFGDPVKSRKQLGHRSAVAWAHGADTIDAHREHVVVRAGERNIVVVVDLHAGLSGQRVERAGRAGCSRT